MAVQETVMGDAPVVIRYADEHGWLRRPECDGSNFNAWERPDGRMVAVEKGRRPTLATMNLPIMYGSPGQ
jgi:hypothetical protein